jgi:hypothetical protein
MKFKSQEYVEGWKACESGVSFNDNPYGEDTKEGKDWVEGYDEYNGDSSE